MQPAPTQLEIEHTVAFEPIERGRLGARPTVTTAAPSRHRAAETVPDGPRGNVRWPSADEPVDTGARGRLAVRDIATPPTLAVF